MALFDAKVAAFQLRRAVVEAGRAPPRLARSSSAAGFPVVVAEALSPLWSDPRASEQAMQLGKVQNLRRAAAALDGLVLAPGQVFSFWRHVGRATRARGYVPGRMLREGCLTPALGGGLCQLSNALHDVAVQSGCRIVERHAHSRPTPGSAAAPGRDATVAWNYVDLRFAAPRALRLGVRLGAGELTVRLQAAAPSAPSDAAADPAAASPDAGAPAQTCGACDRGDCFLHEHGARPPAGRAAFVVDEAWPEFIAYVGGTRAPADLLLAPTLRRWPAEGFAAARQAWAPALIRALAWRLTPPQGPARRAADAAATARIAAALGRRLPPDVLELTLAQSLLPTLWADSALGGRRFSVLMTRLPLAVLQARLDAACAAHPERATLADFRAPAWLADAEAEALAAADAIVTPHAEIAGLFGGKARLLPWRRPPPAASPPRPGDVFAFPGPTVARKGAFELREAALALGARVRPLGAELEGPGFWRGVAVDGGDAGLDGVCAVVHPALAEAAPRRLLAALAAGVPVIATAACGLPPQPGLTLVPMGDAAALAAAMAAARDAGRAG